MSLKPDWLNMRMPILRQAYDVAAIAIARRIKTTRESPSKRPDIKV